jgi:Fur family zinc uptake transcriptional regulator
MNEASTPNSIPASGHNHSICVTQALETAEKLCRERGLRFTALRQQVLRLVWDSHKPVGAYDILDSLKQVGKKAAPPTVYRALDFLIEADLVHRLDSLNAFVGCPDPSSSHRGQFLICRGCRTVAELDDAKINTLVRETAADLGFSAEHQMLEIQGLCQSCRDTGL